MREFFVDNKIFSQICTWSGRRFRFHNHRPGMNNQIIDDFDPFPEGYAEYLSHDVPLVSSNGEVTSPKKDRASSQRPSNRGGNFSIDEDKNLVSAWLNTSIDAIQGTDQKAKTFWSRIAVLYNESKGANHNNRSERSLNSRWSAIQLSVNKFCGFLTQFEESRPSGMNEIDKIQMAKEMYHEMIKTHFQFDHCWNLLRHQPKWNFHMTGASSKRKQIGGFNNNSVNAINIEDDEFSGSASVERPSCRNAEKEARKKGKFNRSGLAEVVVQLTLEQKKAHADRMALAEAEGVRVKKEWEDHLALEASKLEVEKVKAEAKLEKVEQLRKEREFQIMMTDMNSLSDVQRQYILDLQAQILERRGR